jgi:hypothetical protein
MDASEEKMMKTILAAMLLMTAAIATAQVHVNGYTKKDGTYVAPHQRTAPNTTTLDNYSTKGNVNPYTGQPGTKNPAPEDYQAPYTRTSPTTVPPAERTSAPNPYGAQPPQPVSGTTNRW